MPSFNLKCNSCAKEIKKLMPKFKVLECNCGGEYHRTNDTQANTMIKETLDNGFMTRKVERICGVKELMHERSKEKKDPEII